MAVFPGTTTVTHGQHGYNQGCRCDVCKTAKRKADRRRKARLKGTEPPSHGTSQSYSVYGCRCEVCVNARRDRRRKYEAKLAGTGPPEHGLVGYRVYKCRCEVCVGARRANDKKRMARPEVYAKEKERCWRKYGILNFTYEDYLQMLEDQGGKCAICGCGIKLKGKKKSDVAQVDHNHETGEVRALLCHNCNKMIGCGGKPSILRIGAEYLEKHSGRELN